MCRFAARSSATGKRRPAHGNCSERPADSRREANQSGHVTGSQPEPLHICTYWQRQRRNEFNAVINIVMFYVHFFSWRLALRPVG